jgi:hypothetical protein
MTELNGPDTIPYTHWAYFPSKAGAQRCAQDLVDYVTRIRETEDSQWLLLAARDVEVDRLPDRHREVEAIVTRHGGEYDGGEVTFSDGKPVADPIVADGF